MKLEQLQHIIEIEKQKSISKAAKALYIGQPTLSGSLTSLEEEIGVKLFERTYSGVIPTEEGKEAVQLAKQALEAVNGIQNLGQSRKEITGTVTVLLGHVYNYLYNDILLQFHKRYPQAKLKLLVRTHDEIINELLDGKADIGMVPVADEKFFSKGYGREAKNFRIEIFGNYKVKAFASPNSSYVNQTEISDVELQQEQLL
ncbi:MAG: LysR family transcriptional regulator, partial [Peptococcaceae bacterium]|nr:LysR family transcriptional regulator [Peptococcaceae bacterium]